MVWEPSLFCEWLGRWNSPYINHFISADTIVPSVSNPQSLNRYSYVNNNPLRFTDPTGHYACGDGEEHDCNGNKQDPNRNPHPPKPPKQKKDDPDGYDTPDIPGQCDRPHCYDEREYHSDFWYYQPDYVVLGGSFPLIPLGAFFAISPTVTIVRDRYNNWYIGGGFGFTTMGKGVNLSGGDLLFLDSYPSESELESFLTKHSVTLGGGIGIGGGITWGDPSLIRRVDLADFAVEKGIYTPGAGLSYTYSGFIYNAGDETPWFFQD